MKNWKKCLELFGTFFKIGLFTFGGGYAMISLIMTEAGDKRGWIDEKELSDIVAIAESTPGPIAINSATYIGYRCAGVTGALAATLGVTLPSLCVIYAISALKAVQSAFQGIRIAVDILILRAGVRLIVKAPRKPLPVICCAAAFALALMLQFDVLSFSATWLILAGALVGLAAQIVSIGKMKGGERDA